MLPKILVMGWKRSGKDTLGEILNAHGHRCMSSSAYATDRIMMPYFRSIGTPYISAQACFDDRENHRPIWYQKIEEYNEPTWNRVTREIFAEGYNVYLGMRSPKEMMKSRHLYTLRAWVDASKRLPPEDISSCGVTANDAEYIIDNNGTLAEFHVEVQKFIQHINTLQPA